MSRGDMEDQRKVAKALQAARPNPSGWHRAKCPLCEERTGKVDRKGALSINVHSGVYYCWKCGATGCIREGEREVRDAPPERKVEAFSPPEEFTPILEPALSLDPARIYLEGRGLALEMLALAGVGACSWGRYARWVVVPVLGAEGGRGLGWVGRTWVKGVEPTYYYPVGMARGSVLYNQGALTAESDGPVYVVEGVFDALALGQDAVAVLGKASENHVEMLAGCQRPVVVVLDGDAWLEGLALAMRLRLHGQRAGSVRLPPKTDPDEVPFEWVREEARRSLE